MPPLMFAEARETVLRTVRNSVTIPSVETVPLEQCIGRVLAAQVRADRPYPPFRRAARDGFAVRAADFPGKVKVVGEVRAGSVFDRSLRPGECVEIMTGAPVPDGADAIIMVEHTHQTATEITTEAPVTAGDHVIAAGSECPLDGVALWPGTRIDVGHLPSLATIGVTCVQVYRQPRVSILATGDELVAVDVSPAPHQIRNSNSHTLAAQIIRAGGISVVLPTAPDHRDATRDLILQAIDSSDMVVLSGGVSAGKYDVVEDVLSTLGAEFCFDRVRIQPGQPTVFGRVRNRFFFGLPGNPLSTMVTFELFARAALDLLAGCTEPAFPISWAKLTAPFRHKSGLTRFLPALLQKGVITPVRWQGSGDVFALARANAFLVARDDRETWDTGDAIEVLPR